MLFSQIVGNENVKDRLRQNAREGRISHAQLFLGPEGSGNLAMALAYTQYISCANRTDLDSCNSCSSCIKFNKLVHPDLHFAFPVATTKKVTEKPVSNLFLTEWREAVLKNPYMNLFQWLELLGIENKQGLIPAEESSEILRKLSLKPFESEFKFMLIWMPEKMNLSSANKLLKILEEPPDKTLFLLVAESQDQMLRTILSRTQLVKFFKPGDTEIKENLVEEFGKSESEADAIARLSDGNYNEALRLVDLDSFELENYQVFRRWMQLCYSANVKDLLEWIDDVSKTGREKQKNLLGYGLEAVRNCMLSNYSVNELVKLQGEELKFVQNFSPFINRYNGGEIAEQFNIAIYHIERNANPKILFLDLSLKLFVLIKKAKAA